MGTWFAGKYPGQVRVAQSVALVRQLPMLMLSNSLSILVSAAMCKVAGMSWGAVLFSVALIWGQQVPLLMSWLRLRNRPLPKQVSIRHIRRISIYSGFQGASWGMVTVLFVPQVPVDVRMFLMSGLVAHGVYAVAGFYFIPMACLAYALPAFLAALWVTYTSMPQAPLLPVLLLLIICTGALMFLLESWRRFDEFVTLSTEKTDQSEMMREQKEAAEATMVLKSRFLAAASHDLRQPMHAISLYLGALSEAQLPESAREVVLDARECAHHMNDMFRALLDISRLDTQRAKPQVAAVPIASILAKVNMEYQPLAQAKGLRLKVRDSSAHVCTDPAMVERILMNLVSNAIRYTRHGKILLACRRRGDALRVEVYDTGPGIEESQREAIFQEFYRGADAQRDSAAGLGLGLAIVHRLSASLNTPIGLRSRVGHGSVFSVDLPLIPGLHEEAERGAESPQARPSLNGLANALVVVIDDEPTVLGAASFLLREAGCKVIGGVSCEEVLAKLSTSPRAPDAIVCDYQLGEAQNGIEVIQMLREEFNVDIPALLITGDTTGSWRAGLARAPGLPVLHKPLMADSFRQAVAQLLRAPAQAQAA